MHERATEGESGTTSGIVWEGMTEMTMQTKAPESQFAYVVLAARRARQLMAGAPPLIENPRTLKATRIACEELENSLIEYDFTEPSSIDVDKEGNKRRK
jgi:DNA-directed RNA polymerase omega subunit